MTVVLVEWVEPAGAVEGEPEESALGVLVSVRASAALASVEQATAWALLECRLLLILMTWMTEGIGGWGIGDRHELVTLR